MNEDNPDQQSNPALSTSILNSLSQPKTRTRVWRACEICRKRKIKCDGQDPCAFCVTSKKSCTFKEISDNASGARQLTSNMDNRLRNLEQVVAPIAAAFEQWARSADPDAIPFKLAPRTETGKNSPMTSFAPYEASIAIRSMMDNPGFSAMVPPIRHASFPPSPHELQDDVEDEREGLLDRFSHLTKDSLGNLRFIGGASSLILVEALKSLRNSRSQSPDASPVSVGSAPNNRAENLELPFFRPNMHFRRFEALPRPEDTIFPQPNVSDKLVETYFTRIHHTFPILHKQTFLQKYTKLMKDVHSGKTSSDHAFMSSLFAVFACAESLSTAKPQAPDGEGADEWKWTAPSEYVGLEYYERSMVLFWMGSRLVSLENVQCLALLAICCAGWNTLSQSWLLAGQATRAAQDLGLHRSPRRLPLSALEKEHRRRIWWCVYGLDCVLSIALGRPGGINDDDSDVEYPAQVDDEDLGAYCNGDLQPSGNSYMTGFVALLKIYVVAGKIVRCAHSLQVLREIDEEKALPQLVQRLDVMLGEWIESLPQNVKYAANNADDPKMLTLCLIAFFVYYSATINLHRPFISNPQDSLVRNDVSLVKCVSAARACIRIGDMVKSTLPTSHHLAYAVQQICISGVILLRTATHVSDVALIKAVLVDAKRCCQILEDIQEVWPGARRCKEIVSELLAAVNIKWDQKAKEHDFSLCTSIPPIEEVVPPRMAKKRKAENTELTRETRMRLDAVPSMLRPTQELREPHDSLGLSNDYDFNNMTMFDPSTSAVNQPFSGYDFLGNDLEVLLGRIMERDTAADPPRPDGIYDSQMLWEAWEKDANRYDG